jgi:hypothetical protein
MPASDTAPKILRIFRSVKVEEERMRRETAALERQRLVASLRLSDDHVANAAGGEPISFSYALRDPRGAVSSMRVLYRRRGTPDFSSLALRLGAHGRWTGEIPGAWTENDSGFALEYAVAVADSDGDTLLRVPPRAEAPFVVDVEPGSVGDRVPITRKPLFWVAIGAVVVGAAATGVVLYSQRSSLPTSDLDPVTLP